MWPPRYLIPPQNERKKGAAFRQEIAFACAVVYPFGEATKSLQEMSIFDAISGKDVVKMRRRTPIYVARVCLKGNPS